MATYINAKLRKAIESNDTRTVNREAFPLFRAEHPDYIIGKSDPAIFRTWVKEFIANATAKPEPKTAKSTEKPKTAGRKTKTETATRDKEEPKPKSKSKTKSGSKSRKTAETETTPEIDTNKVIAKLKADYVSGRISAECFANAISALANI